MLLRFVISALPARLKIIFCVASIACTKIKQFMCQPIKPNTGAVLQVLQG